MRYFLFVKFASGLMHNAFYRNLKDVIESTKQLILDEEADANVKDLPNVCSLKKHLNKHDDYLGQLPNGTWFHIQPQNVFEIVK